MTTPSSEQPRQQLDQRRSELVGFILGLADRGARPTESDWRAIVATARDCSKILEQLAPKDL